MKRYLAILLLFCFFGGFALSQEFYKRKRMEAVAGAGISQFFGDIGGYSQTSNVLGFKDIIFHQTRFNVEGALKYRIINEVSLKLALTFGMFHAIDEKGSNENRGFEATTTFLEPVLTAEYCFIKSSKENSYLYSKGRRSRFNSIMESLDVYFFTGIGGLSYHVKGNDALVAYGMVDGGFTAVIPVGVGANMLVNPDYSFGLELGGRYSFSDYLDGYTSQYSKSNDVYYFLTFTFTYRIPTKRNGIPEFLSKRKY
jgi:hypothetical protein